MPAFGGPRNKYRRQLEQQGKSPAEIEKILEETFGPMPKAKGKVNPKIPPKPQPKKKPPKPKKK